MAQGTFGIGTSIYVERGPDILLLKRALGAAQGSWYIPGGAMELGETPEDCALRELQEETGLVPTGELRLIAVTPMFVYNKRALVVEYACACEQGTVELSHEHSEFQWLPAQTWRSTHLSDQQIAGVAERSTAMGDLSRAIRGGLDKYLRSVG